MEHRAPSGGFIGRCFVVSLFAGVSACSANAARSDHSDGPITGSSGGDGMGGTGNAGTEGGVVFTMGGSPGMGVPCTDGTGWACKIAACDGQQKTTVRAKVYAPSGT